MKTTKYFHNLILSIPLTLLTIVPFVWLADKLAVPVDFGLIALGALGWWAALLLRLPVMLTVRKLEQQKSQRVITLASGPAEELVRLVLLLILGLSFHNAYSIGLGWAAIEIIYGIVQGFGMGVLQNRTDPKAEEAKTMLRAMGMDKAMEPSAPFWGVIERLSANALHIGFSLALVISPYLIIVTAPLHSGLNILLTKLLKKSIRTAELTLLAISAVFFAACLVPALGA